MATSDQIPSDLTLEIGVDLTPDAFLAAARHFFGYIEEVAAGLSETPIAWTVKVKEGSNLIAVEPAINTPRAGVEAVYGAVRKSTAALMNGDVDGAEIGERALFHAKALSQLASAKKVPIPLRFWVERRPLDVGPRIAEAIQEDWRSDYKDVGTLEGRLRAIHESGATLKVRISDPLYSRPIDCRIPESMLDEAFSKFRRRVEVSGMIHYRKNGTPINIDVSDIEALPEDDDLPTPNDVRGILATDPPP